MDVQTWGQQTASAKIAIQIQKMVVLLTLNVLRTLIVPVTKFATQVRVFSQLRHRFSPVKETTTALWVCFVTLALLHVLIVYQMTTVTSA